MTTIISEQLVCDGYDVRVQLEDGSFHTFHFLAQPENTQESIDSLVANMVDEPVFVDPIQPQESPIEAAFKAQRDEAKLAIISYIYQNAECSEDDILKIATDVAPMINSSYLLNIYIVGAYNLGYINESSFESFKAFILSKTSQELMEI